jgi:teichuronic acid biosynthesis glycosyltransferase TuaC
MRALVLSNMLPDAAHPERGRFVRDQVDALRELGDWNVELYEFSPGPSALIRAARDLRRRYAGEPFDVVHAHFGLTAWPALAVKARGRALTVHGTDVRHPRTRLATGAVLPTVGLLGAASDALVQEIPGRRARARARVLPCGVDVERFKAMSRVRARDTLNLDPQAPYLLFPADPARPEKRHDRAKALAEASGARLLTLGGVEPERVPLYVNAANAVLVPSEREGFGLAVLEALACDVPVIATPVGIHEQALRGVDGTLCAPFELERWRAALTPHLARSASHDLAERPNATGASHGPERQSATGEDRGEATDPPRVAGRAHAERFSATRMAERVSAAWGSLVTDAG